MLPQLLPTTQCVQFTMTDRNGDTLALTMSQEDLYAPKKTGVYGLYAAPLNNTNKAQMFAYDADKDTIKPHLYNKYVLTEGVKNEVYAFYDLGLMNQKFQIDTKYMKIFSEITKRTIFLFEKAHLTKTEKGKNVKMSRIEDQSKDPRYVSSNWLAQVCDEEAESALGLKKAKTAAPAKTATPAASKEKATSPTKADAKAAKATAAPAAPATKAAAAAPAAKPAAAAPAQKKVSKAQKSRKTDDDDEYDVSEKDDAKEMGDVEDFNHETTSLK